MHEVGLMQNALDLALRHAAEQGAKRIDSLHLRVGAFSGVVPEALRFAFEALRQSTIAEGARLDIEQVPLRCVCKSCKAAFQPDTYDLICPGCGSSDLEFRSGWEMNLVSIEVT